MNYDWDWAASEKEFKQAITLNPNYPTAHHWYAEYLVAVGKSEASLSEIERARELDPLSLVINTDKGKILFYSRKYPEAIEQLKRTLELESDYVQALNYLAAAESANGSYEEANETLEKLKRVDPEDGASGLACLHAFHGQTDEALRMADQFEHIFKQGYVDPSRLVGFYIASGNKDKSFLWLEKELENHSVGLTSLKVNPEYDSLRSDSRFAELLRRVGLP
ncbi:MAG TPA: tetratricopeptide repeat protein [Pyrinomonadaceae bacterium]|nr:tetratricopeptide repeat protein [Pyrinomonadaceae bacterium]